MANKELVEYITLQTKNGLERKVISDLLTKGGWALADVESVFMEANVSPQISSQAPVSSEKTNVPVEGMGSRVETYVQKDVLTSEGVTVGKDFLVGSKPTDVETAPVAVETAHTTAPFNPLKKIEQTKNPVNSHIDLSIVVSLIVLVILGGVAFGYYALNKTPALTPYEVLTTSLKNLSDTTSVKDVGDVSMSGVFRIKNMFGEMGDMGSSALQEASGSYTLNYTIKRSMTEEKGVNTEGTLNLKINGQYSFMSINIEAEVDIVQLDNVVYLKLKKMTPLPIPVDLSMLQGKWIAIDGNKFLEEQKMQAGNVDVSEVVKPEDLIAMLQHVLEDQDIIDFVNTKFVLVEDVEGSVPTEAYHYRVILSAQDLETLIVETSLAIQDTQTFREKLIDETDSDFDINTSEEDRRAQLVAKLHEELGDEEWKTIDRIASSTVFDYWVDKKSLLPVRFTSSFEGKDIVIEGSSIDLTISTRTDLSEFNQPLDIQVPKDFQTLEDLAKEFTGDPDFNIYDPYAEVRLKGADASIQANLRNMRAQAELYYDKNGSYEGLCSDRTAQDMIENAENEGSDTTCRDTKTAYVIEAPLIAEPSTYFCVDSIGYADVRYSKLEEDALICEVSPLP